MLYWICPECGRECSPAVRECPTCAAQSVQQRAPQPAAVQKTSPDQAGTGRAVETSRRVETGRAVEPSREVDNSRARESSRGVETGPNVDASHELLSLAETFQSSPPAAPSSAAPSSVPPPSATAHRQQLAQTTTATVVIEEPPSQPEPELSDKLAPLDSLLIRAAAPGRPAPAKVSPADLPVRVSYPALIPGEASNTAESGLALAGPAAAENMGFQPAPGDFRTIEPAAEPLPSQHRSVAFVRADLQAVVRGEMALAAPLNTRAPNRKSDLWAAVPAPLASEPLPYKSRDPALAPSCLSPTGEALSDLLNALITSAEDRERAAILAIHASFSQEPGVILLPAPREIVMAPAPPAEQWMRSGKLKFTAAAPLVAEPRVPAEPRHPTLAGPSLPPQLLNLDLQNSTLGPRRKRVSSWMITLIAATVLVVGVASVLQFGNANRDTASASTAGPPSMPAPAQPARAAAAPIHVVQEHPAARSVEVAGVRVVPGPNKKTQLEYLVINHSALDLAGLNIRIAVRSVDALAGPPLFSVSNIIATLAANQSKEIRTDLDSTIQPAALPDWQSLRTEVLIARQ